MSVSISALDFQSALFDAYKIVSETIDINILHDIDNSVVVEKHALVIHSESRMYRFWPIEQSIDGFYQYNEDEFSRFTSNLRSLDENSVAREKIKSAIRFYKLGNDSIEVEHKILNYWIGFEQLYSSVDSDEDSISRIKSYFISINCVFYLQRKTKYLINNWGRSGLTISIPEINSNILTMINNTSEPLVKYRFKSFIDLLTTQKNISKDLNNHRSRMEQHITRIYRVRNEIVHEGRSSVDLFLLAGHLRHYLLFSIEKITNELIENPALTQLDDVFTYFESLLEQIMKAANIQEIFHIKQYDGYME